MNEMCCRDCKFYDAITPPKGRVGSHGRCAKRSVYPLKEGPGQVFPEGAKRMPKEEDLAKPFVVEAREVVPSCTQATRKA